MNYDDGVLFSSHIKTLALSLVLTGFSAAAVNAASLTPEERNICPTLRVCVDIIRRHDASEFDYGVLETEFQRFGPAGRKALMDVLESEAGNPDIARIIVQTASLSAAERLALQKKWSLKRADVYLPFLLDGHPLSRDLLLLSLGSDNPDVREQSRLALMELSEPVKRQAVSPNLLKPLLTALSKDPVAQAGPYIARLNPDGHTEAFAALLKSGEPALVEGAYEALYRHNQASAFKTLLSEMDEMESVIQSQAVGNMLLRRHAKRADGFYLNFAKDLSGDASRSVSARASGLHGVLLSRTNELPAFTPARAQALVYLVSKQPFTTQSEYLPHLKRLKAENELMLIWNIATEEKWVNRDVIAAAFEAPNTRDKIIADLIRSDDFRSFSAGAALAKPHHNDLLRSKINHPVKAIQDLARKTLKLPAAPGNNSPCIISKFDFKDRLKQMPFFELAWMTKDNNARVVLERKFLTTAHPSQSGWLAGYDLQKSSTSSADRGAALLHFDNKTGDFKQIGDFSGPIAILPDRLLKIGQTTDRFWVIDKSGNDVSAYSVNVAMGASRIKSLGAIPGAARDFSVAPNGDLLMQFDGKTQAPIRMTPRGDISLACRPSRAVTAAPAPN